jgi:hypothetical protein
VAKLGDGINACMLLVVGNVLKDANFKDQERDVRITLGLGLGIQLVRMGSTVNYVRIVSRSRLK